MGYDIYAERRPGTDEQIAAARKRAFDLFEKARAEGVQDPWESESPTAIAALAASNDAERLGGYFHLNVRGMDVASSELVKAGAMVLADCTPFPHHDDPAHEDGDLRCATCDEWRSQGIDGPGIPSFKVGSNDGWLINPIEIETGLNMAAERDPEWRSKLTGYVNDFVEYLDRVRQYGGCRVW